MLTNVLAQYVVANTSLSEYMEDFSSSYRLFTIKATQEPLALV